MDVFRAVEMWRWGTQGAVSWGGLVLDLVILELFPKLHDCDQPQLPMKVQCWVGLGGAVSCVLLGVVFGGTEAVVKSRMWVHCKAWQRMNVNNTVGKCSGNPSSV